MPKSETRVTSAVIRQRRLHEAAPRFESVEATPRRALRSDVLLKNLGLAAALVLCAVTLRTGAIPALDPAADVILTAATDDSLLDEQLGKLSFVSALFPEAVLVFGENTIPTLANPVEIEQVTHAWSEQEPYTAWAADGGVVTAAAAGEVTAVYHANGGERIVSVLGEDGYSCLYSNLEYIGVQIGDAVAVGDVIGQLQAGQDLVFEVRRNGISIDPAACLLQ